MDPKMDASDINNQATEIKTAKPLERSKKSKLYDGVIILIILIIAVLIEFQLIKINPNKQYIPASDINYNFAYPDLPDTIDDAGLMMIVILPWYILFIFSTICLYYFDKEFSINEWKTHFYLMNRMLFFCFAVTMLVTDTMKLFVGSPRPYFISAFNEHGNVTEIRLSFPSGHASLSTACCSLLTILMYKSWKYTQNMFYYQSYVIGMKTYNPHAYYLCGFWWVTREIQLIAISFVFIPMYIALWCSLTRITDYKHFAADVVAGMIVGVCIAYITHLIYYGEMYSVFDHRLNTQIEQSQQNEHVAPLETVIVEQK